MIKKVRTQTDTFVGFGKYKDKTLTWVAENDIEFFKQIENLYLSKFTVGRRAHYKKVKARFLKNDGFLKIHKYEKEIHIVAGLMRERLSSKEVREQAKTRFSKLKPSAIESIISDAIRITRREFELEKTHLLDIHLVRYEQIYQENFKPDLDYVPPAYRKAVMCEHHLTAMEILFQKEKLLGVHTKKFKAQAAKSVLKRSDTDFDFSTLSAKERVELFALLNKAKPIVHVIKPIQIGEPTATVNNSSTAIESTIESPIKQSIQTDIKGEENQKEIIDSGKSFVEVQIELKKSLEDKVRELFEKKNKK